MRAPADVLPAVLAAVEAEGARLADEFYRPDGARGKRGSAPIDTEIEERLRSALQALVPCTFAGEETGTTPGTEAGWTWLVDPQDGTSEFISGRRGSAVAVALLRGSEPVLGVVHSPNAPDRGRDTIAWAEGLPHLLRNGMPIASNLAQKRIEPGALVWATASSALRPDTYARACAPARFVAMPSIAYRLARVAAGDGVATLSVHPVNEYDVAAGLALIRGARGVMLDFEGREVVLSGSAESRLTGCYAGAPQAAAQLAQFDWARLHDEPRRAARVQLGYPRARREAALSRAVGCLLGLVLGDAAAVLHARAVLNGAKADSAGDSARLRAIPLGIVFAGNPGRAAAVARNEKSSAALAAAIAQGIAGGSPEAMVQAALQQAPDCAEDARLQRAFRAFREMRFEDALRAPDAAMTAALAGAARGREAVTPQRILQAMAHRPPERPIECWTDDVLDLAEALLLKSGTDHVFQAQS